MTKHHHQSKEDQINNKESGKESFQFEKNGNRIKNKSEPRSTKTDDLEETSIQLLAYQIYQEKGGSDFDNWLEAENRLRNK